MYAKRILIHSLHPPHKNIHTYVHSYIFVYSHDTQLHKACGVCIYTLYMYVSMYIAVAVARFPRIPYT